MISVSESKPAPSKELRREVDAEVFLALERVDFLLLEPDPDPSEELRRDTFAEMSAAVTYSDSGLDRVEDTEQDVVSLSDAVSVPSTEL